MRRTLSLLLALALCVAPMTLTAPPAEAAAAQAVGYVVMYDRNTFAYQPKPMAVYMSWVNADKHITTHAPLYPFGWWYIETCPIKFR